MKLPCSTVASGVLATLLLSNHCVATSMQRQRGRVTSRKLKTYPIYEEDELERVHDVLDTVTDTVSPITKQLRIDEMDLYELSTIYEGGWVQDGIMFDVRVTNSTEGISVLGLDMLTPVAFESLCVEIYSRDGSYEGYDTTSSAWDFLGSVQVMGLGEDMPTVIPVGSFDPVYIGPDSTRAFYITTQNQNLRYTAYSGGEHTSGSVFSSSSEAGVNVDVLVGVAKNYPFGQSWPDRMFNGAIHYAIGNDLDLGTVLSDIQASTAEIANRGKFTCDVEPISVTDATDASVTSSPLATDTSTGAIISPSPVATVVSEGTPAASPSFFVSTPTIAPIVAVSTGSPVSIYPTEKLATTLQGGLKQAGVMFDVRVPSIQEGGPAEGATILTFEVSTSLTEEICVEAYSKEGTHVGYESDVQQGEDGSWSSSTWSSLGAATTTGFGETGPTQLPVGALDQVYIGPGETRAFYLTMNIPEMRYTEPLFNEKTGDVFVESRMNYLQIMVGTAMSYPFKESWADRIYNGAVVFALGEVEDEEFSQIASSEKARSCAALGAFPTKSPTVSVSESNSPVQQTGSTQSVVSGSESENAQSTTISTVAASSNESDADASKGEVDSAIAEDQTKDVNIAKENKQLSAVAIIVLAAVAGCVVLALILIFVKGRNNKVKRASEEMFHEFDEDLTELGPNYGHSSRKPVDTSFFPRSNEESSLSGNAPMIINEQDELSLISNDLSKPNYAFPAPNTPGSDAGSRSSKGSVKFVRAGESFTSRSYQPEDTVDL